MKLYINARFLTQPISGVQRYALECSREIQKLYNNLVFVAPGNILHKDLAKELNVQIIGRYGGHRWEQIELPRYLRKQGSHPLLNLANTGPLRYPNNYLAIHDLAFEHHPEWFARSFALWYRFLLPRLAMRAQHVFAVSCTIAAELEKVYRLRSDKISVTYNGLAAGFQRAEPVVLKKKLILAVGSFDPRKNHDKLISAFLASNLSSQYQLLIVGGRSRVFPECMPSVSHPAVRLSEYTTDAQLIAHYRDAEMFVSLSAYEGFGIPVLEALCADCKVLCSDIPVYRELFSGSVYFCNPNDHQNLISALEALANVRQQRVNFGLIPFKQYNYAHSAAVILRALNQHSS